MLYQCYPKPSNMRIQKEMTRYFPQVPKVRDICIRSIQNAITGTVVLFAKIMEVCTARMGGLHRCTKFCYTVCGWDYHVSSSEYAANQVRWVWMRPHIDAKFTFICNTNVDPQVENLFGDNFVEQFKTVRQSFKEEYWL